MGIRQNAGTGGSAQQLIDRNACLLGFDVPQSHIHGGDGGHGHRTTLPVRALVQVLPNIFDVVLVLADKARCNGLEIFRGNKFASVQGGVTKSNDAVGGGDAKDDEVASRACHEDFSFFDCHGVFLSLMARHVPRHSPHLRRGSLCF